MSNGRITSRHDPRFSPTLYKHVGVENSHTMEYYRSHGGYETARAVLTSDAHTPESVVKELQNAGLRGRGGGGFPTGLKWSFMPPPDGGPRYIVCNADESEPGSFKDRYLLEDDPHQIIEGMIISAFAMKLTYGFIYIRGEYYRGYTNLWQAVHDAREAGFLGKNIFGSGIDFDITVHRGAGAYICGEETALMNSLEGLRANPRLKPPFPAQAGVYGRPTTINNVESIANATQIMRHGADWHANIGTEDSKGTKVYQISGAITRPGLYELPMGATFRELLYDFGGGPIGKGKAFIPGGSSAPMFPWRDEFLDMPMDHGTLAKNGSMLGTGGVIVIPEDKCIVDALYNLVRFYAHESCGKCTPCREGVGYWMPRMYKKLLAGLGTPHDLEMIEEMSVHIRGRSFCLLADSCIMPIQGSLRWFRHEYEYLIENGKPMYQKKDRWQQ